MSNSNLARLPQSTRVTGLLFTFGVAGAIIWAVYWMFSSTCAAHASEEVCTQVRTDPSNWIGAIIFAIIPVLLTFSMAGLAADFALDTDVPIVRRVAILVTSFVIQAGVMFWLYDSVVGSFLWSYDGPPQVHGSLVIFAAVKWILSFGYALFFTLLLVTLGGLAQASISSFRRPNRQENPEH